MPPAFTSDDGVASVRRGADSGVAFLAGLGVVRCVLARVGLAVVVSFGCGSGGCFGFRRFGVSPGVVVLAIGGGGRPGNPHCVECREVVVLLDFSSDQQRHSMLFDGALRKFVRFRIGRNVDFLEQETVASDDSAAAACLDVGWHPYDGLGRGAIKRNVHHTVYSGQRVVVPGAGDGPYVCCPYTGFTIDQVHAARFSKRGRLV